MRALICRQWGGIEQLQIGEAPMPRPGRGEVLIRVKATAVNYADAIMVAGRYQTKPELPFSPGLETAGVIEACGPDVQGLKPGDRVMAILAYGGLAEYAVAPAAETYVIPHGPELRRGRRLPDRLHFQPCGIALAGPAGTGRDAPGAGRRGRRRPDRGGDRQGHGRPRHRRRQHGGEAGRGHGARRRRHGELHEREADRAGDGADRRQGLPMSASIPSAASCSMRRCRRSAGAGASCWSASSAACRRSRPIVSW